MIQLLFIFIAQIALANPEYYEFLGVPSTASQSEIEAAYLRISNQHHPAAQRKKSPEQKAESSRIFNAAKMAYDVLSMPRSRAQYDKMSLGAGSNDNVDDTTLMIRLKLRMEALEEADTPEKIVETLSNLRDLGAFIYRNYQAGDFVLVNLRRLAKEGKFVDMDAAKTLLAVTHTWDRRMVFVGGHTAGWKDTLYGPLIISLIEHGYSLKTIMNMFSTVKIFGGTFEFQLTRRASWYLLPAMARTGQISSAAQFSDAVKLLKTALKDDLHFSLQRNLIYILPIINQMQASDLVDLSRMMGSEPIEVLAFIESLFKFQRDTHRLSMNELRQLLLNALERGFFTEGKRVQKTNPNGLEHLDNHYLATHNGYDLQSLEVMTKDAIVKSNSFGRVELSILYPFLRDDVINLIARNLDLFQPDSEQKKFDWTPIAEGLKISKYNFLARLHFQRFSPTQSIQWVQKLLELKPVLRSIEAATFERSIQPSKRFSHEVRACKFAFYMN